MLIVAERFWKMVLLSVNFEYVENLGFVCMNVVSVAYGNGLMIGVYCFWIALDLHLGPCLCYLAVLHLQVSSLGAYSGWTFMPVVTFYVRCCICIKACHVVSCLGCTN